MTSKARPLRICPMWGGACTVAPHRYIDTRPACSGVNSRTLREAVSYRCMVTPLRLGDH